jgi:hypothetical protein
VHPLPRQPPPEESKAKTPRPRIKRPVCRTAAVQASPAVRKGAVVNGARGVFAGCEKPRFRAVGPLFDAGPLACKPREQFTAICGNSPGCRGTPIDEAAYLLVLPYRQKGSDQSRGSSDRVMRIMHSGWAATQLNGARSASRIIFDSIPRDGD